MPPNPTINDRSPNWRGEDGRLYLKRCFACGGTYGTENWAPAASSGECAWCGWKDVKLTGEATTDA